MRTCEGTARLRRRRSSIGGRGRTNLAFKQWGTVFPGAACVVALVDRFAQHCHRVEIPGPSWRDKHRLDPDDRRRQAGRGASPRSRVDCQITTDLSCRLHEVI
jgi:hypothetical protein